MHRRWRRGTAAGRRGGLAIGLVFVISGCGAPPTPLSGLNASYERALVRTAPRAVMLDGKAEQRVFDKLQRYFAGMTPASVREQTAMVYAPGSYLNDTLVGIDGAPGIEGYFGHTVESTDVLTVEFLDRAPVGIDWYVRWRMTVVVKGLNGGAPVISYGVSQLRFDADGRVLLHKDFWDSGTGLHEQLPVLGTIVGRVRAAIAPGASEALR
ncbi:MAG: hypothetical protein E4H19_10095 [Chromatiales bacterium]|jgi:hypothetical protein|nr:MAG: hypothetical protein E4H19_10095 [Chromatiales bacterium]